MIKDFTPREGYRWYREVLSQKEVAEMKNTTHYSWRWQMWLYGVWLHETSREEKKARIYSDVFRKIDREKMISSCNNNFRGEMGDSGWRLKKILSIRYIWYRYMRRRMYKDRAVGELWIADAIKYREKGLSKKEVAKKVGKRKADVVKALKSFKVK